LALAMLSVSTGGLCLRLRHLPSMRPWLVRHVVGNFVLAIGLFATWFWGLALFFYVLIVAGVFGMWLWGIRELRRAVRENK